MKVGRWTAWSATQDRHTRIVESLFTIATPKSGMFEIRGCQRLCFRTYVLHYARLDQRVPAVLCPTRIYLVRDLCGFGPEPGGRVKRRAEHLVHTPPYFHRTQAGALRSGFVQQRLQPLVYPQSASAVRAYKQIQRARSFRPILPDALADVDPHLIMTCHFVMLYGSRKQDPTGAHPKSLNRTPLCTFREFTDDNLKLKFFRFCFAMFCF